MDHNALFPYKMQKLLHMCLLYCAQLSLKNATSKSFNETPDIYWMEIVKEHAIIKPIPRGCPWDFL